MSEITPFEINISDAEISDLKQRLANTRWANKETVDDWSQGIPLAYIQEVCEYWGKEYDWRDREAKLNRFPQFKTNIQDLDIHFIHVKSPEADATPLIMTHGWPGSIVEFQRAALLVCLPAACMRHNLCSPRRNSRAWAVAGGRANVRECSSRTPGRK